MEWDWEKSLQLIDLYEEFSLLWNPKHGLYYNKVKKQEAWTEIAERMGCSPEEARKKMDSLLGSFRREKSKGKKSVETGKGRRETYVSKWFAFNRMSFLLDRDETRDSQNSIQEEPETQIEEELDHVRRDGTPENNDDAESATSQDSPRLETDFIKVESPQLTRTISSNTSNISRKRSYCTSTQKLRKVRQKKLPGPAEESQVGEALNILKTAAANNLLKADECGIFGQHVANKLRHYSNKRTRDIVQHHINTVLFNADMGRYETNFKRERSFNNCNSISEPSPATDPLQGAPQSRGNESQEVYYDMAANENLSPSHQPYDW